MADLNPIENELINRLNLLEDRLKALETVRQQYIGDWYELSPASVVIDSVTDNLFHCDFSPSTRFSSGDKFRVSTDGINFTYGIVIGLSEPNRTITLNGDGIVALHGTTFLKLSYSKVTTPIGYPSRFRRQSNVVVLPDAGLASVNAEEMQWNYIGNIAMHRFRIDFTTSGAANHGPVVALNYTKDFNNVGWWCNLHDQLTGLHVPSNFIIDWATSNTLIQITKEDESNLTNNRQYIATGAVWIQFASFG